MRYLVVLLVGLAVGAIGTMILINAMHRETAYEDALMTVMGQQMKALDKSVKQSRCAPTDLTPRLQTLRLLANDIETAFPDMQDETQFGRYAGQLRAASDAALMAPPTSCAAAVAAVSKLDKTCDSCHRDYRN